MIEHCRAWSFDVDHGLRLQEIRLGELSPGWVRCRILRVQPSVGEAVTLLGLAAILRGRGEFSWGHEFVAEVDEVAAPGPAALVGRRVVCPPTAPCGTCLACCKGQPYRCTSGFRLGHHTRGAFCDVLDLPARHVLALSSGASERAACCSQPVASVVANLEHACLRRGQHVVILGQGTMGLFALQAARVMGAAAVLTTARRPAVRRLSESLGADASLDPHDPDLPARLRDFGPDIIVDAAGGPTSAGLAGNATLSLALDIVPPYGTILELSDLSEPMRMPPEVRDKSVRIVFGQSSYYYGLYEYALELLADRRIVCDPLVTHEVRGVENLPQALDIKIHRSTFGAIQVQVIVGEPSPTR